MNDRGPVQHRHKVPIAVFDFDGTIIDGQSSVALVLLLIRKRLMSLPEAVPVGWWGLRYKLHLPHEQYEVRSRVFEKLLPLTVDEVDRLCDELYRKKLVPEMREQAVNIIERYKSHGVEVLIVSASFESIISRVSRGLGVHQISTKMKVKDNHYTPELAAAPVEGYEKPHQLKEWANERYGEGGWRLVAAYGDHHTDIPLLSMAEHGYAVEPDWLLGQMAKSEGWTVLRWRRHVSESQRDLLLTRDDELR
ncbi:MAG: HAD-IB family hydrolase [Coriobacteriales bacterium]|nr:HAD-IB family hydrolase [Coriobacteriales bacterium]